MTPNPTAVAASGAPVSQAASGANPVAAPAGAQAQTELERELIVDDAPDGTVDIADVVVESDSEAAVEAEAKASNEDEDEDEDALLSDSDSESEEEDDTEAKTDDAETLSLMEQLASAFHDAQTEGRTATPFKKGKKAYRAVENKTNGKRGFSSTPRGMGIAALFTFKTILTEFEVVAGLKTLPTSEVVKYVDKIKTLYREFLATLSVVMEPDQYSVLAYHITEAVEGSFKIGVDSAFDQMTQKWSYRHVNRRNGKTMLTVTEFAQAVGLIIHFVMSSMDHQYARPEEDPVTGKTKTKIRRRHVNLPDPLRTQIKEVCRFFLGTGDPASITRPPVVTALNDESLWTLVHDFGQLVVTACKEAEDRKIATAHKRAPPQLNHGSSAEYPALSESAATVPIQQQDHVPYAEAAARAVDMASDTTSEAGARETDVAEIALEDGTAEVVASAPMVAVILPTNETNTTTMTLPNGTTIVEPLQAYEQNYKLVYKVNHANETFLVLKSWLAFPHDKQMRLSNCMGFHALETDALPSDEPKLIWAPSV